MRRNARRGPGALEQRDFELVGCERVAVGAEELRAEPDRGTELHAGLVLILQRVVDRLRGTAEGGVAVLVDDDAVVHHVVHLRVVVVLVADFRDEDLHLVRLHLVCEDLVQRLRVRGGEFLRAHVLAGVRVALEVRVAHARDAQQLVLAVQPDRSESDAVVDLADLLQRAGGVLGNDDHPGRTLQCEQTAAAGDALPRVVGAVLHHLFGRDVERGAHDSAPPRSGPCNKI